MNCLALKSDGSIVGWGSNGSGQATPPAGNDFIAISADRDYSMALKSDGSIVGWGEAIYHQLPPIGGTGFFTISAGGDHSVALKGCTYAINGDLNNDCRVDIKDFAQLASNWLLDCFNEPNNPACVHK